MSLTCLHICLFYVCSVCLMSLLFALLLCMYWATMLLLRRSTDVLLTWCCMVAHGRYKISACPPAGVPCPVSPLLKACWTPRRICWRRNHSGWHRWQIWGSWSCSTAQRGRNPIRQSIKTDKCHLFSSAKIILVNMKTYEKLYFAFNPTKFLMFCLYCKNSYSLINIYFS